MTYRLLTMTSALALCAGAAAAQEMNFNRIASFPVALNTPDAETTSAEIIAASGDGMTLIYSDSPAGVVGRIDITDPANPQPLGAIAMDGEPTAVSVLDTHAFVAVNTSENYVETSGTLHVIDLDTGEDIAQCDLGGQPDSTAVAPDGSFLVVAIENERNEDDGDGRVGQMPGGWVSIVELDEGMPDCDTIVRAEVTGLAEISPEDPEPEFVDVNANGEIVVTMQENNHIAILGRDGAVLSHFSAGSVDLAGIDATDEQSAMIFAEDQPARLREPDGVQWIDADHIAIANEGDMDGGARGWTIMDRTGAVIHESGASFEMAIAEVGHYPDRRSDAKGIEPEGMEFATFGDTPMVFLLAERASVVGVFDVTDPAGPVLAQILPTGLAPEGAMAIPSRNLLAVANEADLGADGAVRSHVTLYEYQEAPAAYPHLTSAGATMADGTPIGWAALSGAVADPAVPGRLYAVNDSFFGAQPTIFTIDTTQTPARITDALPVTRYGNPAQKLDMEGIALDGEGGFWIASEGRGDRLIPHAIYHVGADGAIEDEIPFPAELLAAETRFGAEGITLVDDTLWIAIQRPWGEDAENTTKLVAYNLETEEWGAVTYPLVAPETGWVGLSEIVAHGDHVYLIERDNLVGDLAVTKRITRVALTEMVPAPLGGPLPVVTPEPVRDLLADLTSTGGFVLDKVESLAIMADGTAWAMTDNDGVDDHSGETMLWSFPLDAAN